jgi:hypothetical protein
MNVNRGNAGFLGEHENRLLRTKKTTAGSEDEGNVDEPSSKDVYKRPVDDIIINDLGEDDDDNDNELMERAQGTQKRITSSAVKIGVPNLL